MLDKDKEKLCINSYGISITTMEEVFLRVADMDDEVSIPKKLSFSAENK